MAEVGAHGFRARGNAAPRNDSVHKQPDYGMFALGRSERGR